MALSIAGNSGRRKVSKVGINRHRIKQITYLTVVASECSLLRRNKLD